MHKIYNPAATPEENAARGLFAIAHALQEIALALAPNTGPSIAEAIEETLGGVAESMAILASVEEDDSEITIIPNGSES